MLRGEPGEGDSGRPTMPSFAMHEAFLALGVTQGDEVNGADEIGGGGFEMVHGGEIKLLDAVPEEGRENGGREG